MTRSSINCMEHKEYLKNSSSWNLNSKTILAQNISQKQKHLRLSVIVEKFEELFFIHKAFTLKVLNFALFDHFCEILYPRKVSKSRNGEIKYPWNEIPAEFEILFFLTFNQSMILMPVYRISLLAVTKLEFL